MIKRKEMSWKQLCSSYQPSDFSFETTEQIDGSDGIIGQEEAIEALKFGLNLNHKGYNIYVTSEACEDFFDEIKSIIEDNAQTGKVPNDLCYLYNFNNPSKPRIIYMEAGDGTILQDDMKEFSYFVKNELANQLNSIDIQKVKESKITELEYEKNLMLTILAEQAKELGFILNIVDGGISFVEQEDCQLNEVEIRQNSNDLACLAKETIEHLQQVEADVELELINLLDEKLIKEVMCLIKCLKTKYRHYPELEEYFEGIFNDILENSELFMPTDTDERIPEFFPILSRKTVNDLLLKYEVNLLVDNSVNTTMPIITDRDLSYGKLVGSIKVMPDQDLSKINVMSIEAGVLHQAIGGYLIIRAEDLVESVGGWQALRATLRDGVIKMQSPQTTSITTTKYIEPEFINAPMKVILIGSHHLYETLNIYDNEFSKLFKLRVDFEDEMSYTKQTIEKIGYKIKKQCEQEQLRPVTCEALLKAIRYNQSRSDKLSTNITPIHTLIREANSIANSTITAKNIEEAIAFKKTMMGKVSRNIKDNYKTNTILLNVKGRKIGQINGLAVYNVGENKIGQPVKITATTYRGQKGVINIEKASDMSGNIHTKGIEIIEGFLGNHFAQYFEPSLSCKICMEQNYSGVDGDSASSAQLYAIISSLSRVPINQNLAVTGSINQFGEIQPVGGLTEKIEGFFRACKEKGFTKDQGVIIPYQNQRDLVLSEEIIQAIKEGKFHIYPIRRYEQGLELLMGESYKQIETKVYEKLRLLSKKNR
ncbi:MAG: hypothetical protein ATN35_13070 [Epulopiscium sp. Nele67-Bin004]|nr:MAG: hypothetical protein ATN35_13070 [Epulopiscium sp. Nele67-Bin004]